MRAFGKRLKQTIRQHTTTIQSLTNEKEQLSALLERQIESRTENNSQHEKLKVEYSNLKNNHQELGEAERTLREKYEKMEKEMRDNYVGKEIETQLKQRNTDLINELKQLKNVYER